MRSRPLLRTQLCRTKDPFHRAGIPLIVDVTTPRLEFFQRRDWLPVAATPLHGLPTERASRTVVRPSCARGEISGGRPAESTRVAASVRNRQIAVRLRPDMTWLVAGRDILRRNNSQSCLHDNGRLILRRQTSAFASARCNRHLTRLRLGPPRSVVGSVV
jgi:hypothetical protein